MLYIQCNSCKCHDFLQNKCYSTPLEGRGHAISKIIFYLNLNIRGFNKIYKYLQVPGNLVWSKCCEMGAEAAVFKNRQEFECMADLYKKLPCKLCFNKNNFLI
jgi:hypothetical protein